MKPVICSRCKKNVAVVFITKIENGSPTNEGLCLKCAKELGIKPVQDMMQNMGISDEELDGISNEMLAAFGGAENLDDVEDGGEDENGKTATFPFLNKLFSNPHQSDEQRPPERDAQKEPDRASTRGNKRKFLENYCISLTKKAKEGALDRIVGREEETERVIQILNRRQKNNPCLIGEPG
ncbi:MAG: ATP-dependent Clp protease ATP-binding subunit, partial [Oscillospiraceae bacterium]|nr:ATP-dependent Clp protease ATP-binding subunit [Oscillospiraceae bacterium]